MAERLIDANTLNVALRFAESHIIHGESEWLKGYVEGLRAAIAATNDCPTIEAEPVKHGRWINPDNTLYHCSECGQTCPYDISAETPDVVEYWTCNYCLNCGARMDEEDEA